MTPTADHTPLPFTVAMSFLMGIVTTFAVYSLRQESATLPATAVDVSAPIAAAAESDAVNTATRKPSAGAVAEPATPVPPAPVSPIEAGEIVALRARGLKIPVDGVERDDLDHTIADARGSRPPEALDILAPRGTKVRAVEDGRIQKVFTSKAGGLTIYQFETTGTFSYYYAHLDRYADGLREGQTVKRGDVIGYVGSTGNASPDAPHLQFAIFRLGPEKKWWQGEPINPYLVFIDH